MSRFAGRVALVTGASGGVGRAVACRLAGEGAAVGIAGRDPVALAETARQIEQSGGQVLVVRADVTVAADVERAVAAVLAAYGGLDLLAHAAGVLRLGAVTDLPEEDWDLLFATNVKSCYLLARSAIPRMRPRGAIVNVSSVFAFAADRNAAGYAAAKAAVVALTRIMALDHVDEGIRVNCVAPGSMRTGMLETAIAGRNPDDPEAALAQVGRLHPIGRLVDPAEVAALILYLLSDDAEAVVGACYTIDGGRLAKLGSVT